MLEDEEWDAAEVNYNLGNNLQVLSTLKIHLNLLLLWHSRNLMNLSCNIEVKFEDGVTVENLFEQWNSCWDEIRDEKFNKKMKAKKSDRESRDKCHWESRMSVAEEKKSSWNKRSELKHW